MNNLMNVGYGQNFHNQFLKILYGNLEEGVFNLCYRKPDENGLKTESYDIQAQLLAYCKAGDLKDDHEVWYEVCLQKNRPGKRQRQSRYSFCNARCLA